MLIYRQLDHQKQILVKSQLNCKDLFGKMHFQNIVWKMSSKGAFWYNDGAYLLSVEFQRRI